MSRTRRRYGAVRLDYGTASVGTAHSEMGGYTASALHEEEDIGTVSVHGWPEGGQRERERGGGGRREGHALVCRSLVSFCFVERWRWKQ